MFLRLCEIYKIKRIAEIHSEDQEEVSASQLAADEQELVMLFRTLNAEAKGIVLATVRAFTGNPAMQKESTKSEMA